MNNKTQFKLRKILNDLKRRPEDAAKDLGIKEKVLNNILNGETEISFDIIKKAVSVWPVNYGDFFHIEDDAKDGYKIFRFSESENTKRKMYRGGKPYYLYKDTVTSKVSPFRPEWIRQLTVVDDDNPENNLVKYNNGHFLHQFTYFIGPVNFYYVENNTKKVAKMNTGDSMYISPYVPHTFTTRKNEKNIFGHILALTYSDKVDSEVLNELSAIGYEQAKDLRIKLNNELEAFKSSLNYHFINSSLSKDLFLRLTNIKIDDLNSLNSLPDIDILKKIAHVLNIGIKELLPTVKKNEVKIKTYKESLNWFYPSDKNKKYKFVELTNLSQLPLSKGLEMTVLDDDENDVEFQVPTHQYLYNVGKDSCKIVVNKKNEESFSPGDSIYLKPGVKFKFIKKSTVLILRIGGRISGDCLSQVSMLSEGNFKRLIDDNKPWFNK